MLPLAPTPYEDELLSSYLSRLSLAHYMDLSRLMTKHFGHKGYYSLDIDVYHYPKVFWKVMSEMSGVPMARLKRMQILDYAGFVQEQVKHTGRQLWIAPLGNAAGSGAFRNARYCPECLKEAAYYKKEWRLMFVNACPQHRCVLYNSCPECGASIHVTRIDKMHSMAECGKCGFDLRTSRVKEIRTDSEGFRAMLQLQEIAKKGYYIRNSQWHYSIGLFVVLRILTARLIRAGEKKEVIIEGLSKLADIPCSELQSSMYVEELDPHCLFLLIGEAMGYLHKWPKDFEEFCIENKLTNKVRIYDKWRLHILDIPRWFDDGLDACLEKVRGGHKKYSKRGPLEILCHSDRILYSKGMTHEREI